MTDDDTIPRHESVDHQHPTAAETLEEGDAHVPGTGIMGDETLVREVPGGLSLPHSPTKVKHHAGRPHPGPTSVTAMDSARHKRR